jgi:hypothetical protein
VTLRSAWKLKPAKTTALTVAFVMVLPGFKSRNDELQNLGRARLRPDYKPAG